MYEHFQIEYLLLIVASIFVMLWPVEAQIFVALLYFPVFIRMNNLHVGAEVRELTSNNHERT